jgi:riboflavin synthase
MFTGIILAIGQIAGIETNQAGDCRMRIATGKLSLDAVGLGDSIAVNGVCLTAVEWGHNYFCADVSKETLSCTTLCQAAIGMPVNLETALTPSTRMGGHIVSGHVDGVGKIIELNPDGCSIRFSVEAPKPLAKYIAEKGSISIDGISLTVNQVKDAVFNVNIVPHTLQETTLGNISKGASVNLEVDIIARYLERLLLGEKRAVPVSEITGDLLKNSGFIR